MTNEKRDERRRERAYPDTDKFCAAVHAVYDAWTAADADRAALGDHAESDLDKAMKGLAPFLWTNGERQWPLRTERATPVNAWTDEWDVIMQDDGTFCAEGPRRSTRAEACKDREAAQRVGKAPLSFLAELTSEQRKDLIARAAVAENEGFTRGPSKARLDADGTAKPLTEIVAVMPESAIGEEGKTVHIGQATHYVARPTTKVDWLGELRAFRAHVHPPTPCPRPEQCENYSCDVNAIAIKAFRRVDDLLAYAQRMEGPTPVADSDMNRETEAALARATDAACVPEFESRHPNCTLGWKDGVAWIVKSHARDCAHPDEHRRTAGEKP